MSEQGRRAAALREAADDPLAPLSRAAAGLLGLGPRLRTVVLVEGDSDARAVVVLATRTGRDLDAEGVAVVPMGGATNARRFLALLGPRGLDVGLAGLCDAREVGLVRRALELTGYGPGLDDGDLPALGFHACQADLEDELVRVLGADLVQDVVAAEGETASWRALQQQPAQLERPVEQQLRRFLGSRSGRKLRYAEQLVRALDLERVPAPLTAVLTSA